MSRLSEILGVPEGREFKFNGYNKANQLYKIKENKRLCKGSDGSWCGAQVEISLCEMIAHPELIELIPEKPTLTDQQITAIKGRIAEGTPWAARGKDNCYPRFYKNEPINDNGSFIDVAGNDFADALDNSFPFITYENSPVYLPDLIEGSEGE